VLIVADRGIEQRDHVRLDGGVGAYRLRTSSRLADHRDHPVQPFGRAARDKDVPTSGREAKSQRPAQTFDRPHADHYRLRLSLRHGATLNPCLAMQKRRPRPRA
jgi:hypothetical protein